jgi:hypothetical protein
MIRNNTSFPIQITNKIKTLHYTYSTDDKWKNLLSYYQYIVKSVLTDPSFSIIDSRGLLLYFVMGLGKTRTAVSVALSAINRPIVAIIPKSLQKNFEETIKYVEKELGTTIQNKLNYVTLDAYNSAAQLNKLNNINDKLIIVDEAHNLFKAIINGNSNSNAHKIYQTIMNAKNIKILFLTGTPISKDPFELVPCINMLSGKETLPIYYDQFNSLYIDYINKKILNREFLANRLLGLVSYMTISNETKDMFPLELPFIIEKVEMSKFQYSKYLLAREKEELNKKKIIQYSVKAMSIPKQGSMSKYYVDSRSASNFVYSDDMYEGGETKETKETEETEETEERVEETEENKSFAENEEEYDNKKIKSIEEVEKKESEDITKYIEINNTVDKKTDKKNISINFINKIKDENSPKMALIAKRIKNSKGLTLIYSQFVNIHGLKQMSLFLEREGIYNYETNQEEGFKYILYTGDIDQKKRTNLIKIFNSVENKDGNIIKSILISKTGAEGLDLKNIRETHQLEPYWDFSRNNQVKSRAVRYGSHTDLPQSERTVQPYIYLAIANQEMYNRISDKKKEKQTIDEMFYERSVNKKIINDQVNKLLQDVSIECSYFNTSECYTCNPTNERLFTDDPLLDTKISNPCIQYKEEEMVATKIIIGNEEYYYTENPLTVYKYNKSLDGYNIINSDIELIENIKKIIKENISDKV